MHGCLETTRCAFCALLAVAGIGLLGHKRWARVTVILVHIAFAIAPAVVYATHDFPRSDLRFFIPGMAIPATVVLLLLHPSTRRDFRR
jgi:hypothetical protein